MFGKHLQTFARTLDGLRSFVDLVQPFLDKKGQEVDKKHAGNLTPLLLGAASSNPELLTKLGVTESQLRSSFNGNIEIEHSEEKGKTSFSIKVSGPQGKAFDSAITEIGEARQRISLLYQNALISLISTVECFLSQILYTYYDAIPAAMSDKEKVFSFDDLKSFSSVEDARIYLIEKKVTDLMRGSFSDWISFFKKQAGISMGYLDPFMDTLIETCERRNLLVHNDGIVNSIYLSKVSPELREGKKKGEKLQLTRKYLDERIDYFELNTLLIVCELWKKLNPTDNDRAEIISNIAYRHLQQTRWDVAKGLSYFLMMDKQVKEDAQLVGTLNYWQSMKQLGCWDEIKKEAESADFSAKGRRFQLGHLALIEKADEFFAVTTVALKGKEISLEELREFPIFIKMREDKRFNKYRAVVKKIKSINKPSKKMSVNKRPAKKALPRSARKKEISGSAI